MNRTHKEVTLTPEATGQEAASTPQPEEKPLTINRLSDWTHGLLVEAVSHLRLSLTLRIALHYAGQLLRTTIPVLLVVSIALCCLEIGPMRTALYQVAALEPAQERVYSPEQLAYLTATEAYLTEEPYPDGWDGFTQRIKLSASTLTDGVKHNGVQIYCHSHRGGLIIRYPLDQLRRSLTVMFWLTLCCDLMRILYLVNHRHRLNKKVLKPISDMAETAATLSANNLSDRISVDGAKNELKDLALVINGMLDRIELSYNSQKQFVSDASHELRTPIAVIQGYVSMLERWGKTDKEVLDEGITAISQEAASMKELVERLLFLARHDKKTLMLEMEVFDPLEVMSELNREAKMLSTAHEFALEPAENAFINGDKGMIKQLMRILVDNAIKYTPAGSSIVIQTKEEQGNAVICVADDGPGIPDAEKAKVFQMFYTGSNPIADSRRSIGLGLSLCKSIMTAHGGSIRVSDNQPKGTRFTVTIPSGEVEVHE